MTGPLRLFNTMSGRKEPFRPLSAGKGQACSSAVPTVQSLMHLGHARTYIFYDVVARYLATSATT